MKPILYREGYKYALEEDYTVKVAVYPPEDVHAQHIDLLKTGLLTIRRGFPWDGSTCALDAVKSMRGSLIHDALYRLINEPVALLSKGWKNAADYEYYKAMVEDGFPRWWANIRFKAVVKHGGRKGVTAHGLCSAPDKNAVSRDTAGAA